MKLDAAIFCEDIRNEINNKFTLVGIYNEKLYVQSKDPAQITWPIPARLSCWIRITTEAGDGEPNNFEFEYILPSMPQPLKTVGAIKINKKYHFFTVAVIGDGVPLTPGKLGFRLTLKQDQKILTEFVSPEAISVEIEKI